MANPKKIENCPIVDSVIELRFISKIFPNAVFGIIYNSLVNEYPKVEKLPILQLPEQLRDSDPNFKFKAHYKISSEDGFVVQIGPDVIIIAAPSPYPGWTQFSKRIYFVINQILKLNVINEVTRLGVRYINFFENNIFNKVNLHIAIGGRTLDPKNTLFRTEIKKGGFLNSLQIANNATQIIDKIPNTGSIVDIDVFKEYSNGEFKDIYKKEIELAHNTEKDLFFELLTKEFLESLKPSYK